MALTLQKTLSAFLFFCLFLLQNHQINAQGELWGTAYGGGNHNLGVIYKVNPDGTGYSIEHYFKADSLGSTANETLVLGPNGKFYGTTYLGGDSNMGVLFEFDLENNTYTKKFDFYPSDGIHPTENLFLASNGKFYGSTWAGGPNSKRCNSLSMTPINNVYF